MPLFNQAIVLDLFAKHEQEISAFVRRRCSAEQDVADIVQETYTRLAQYQQTENIQNPKGFLFQMAANIIVDWHRRGKVRALYFAGYGDLEAFPDSQLTPDDYWEKRELLELLDGWLEELPEIQRHAFVLYRIEGLTHAKIAETLHISPSTSERYLKAAMLHLSKRMDGL